jgi:sulfate transport system permease protein
MSSPAFPRRRPDAIGVVVLALVLSFVGFLLVIPLGSLAITVLGELSTVASALVQPEALRAMGLTALIAAIVVVTNGVFGIAGAIVVVRHRFVGRQILDALVDLPLALSPVMTGLAFLRLFGRSGILRPMTDALGMQVAFAFPGLVIATLFVTLPFTLREVALVLEELGDQEEQAASSLGASPLQTFLRVTLPNIRHGLVIGTTLTLSRALGEFGAVLVLGGAVANKTQTATTFIHTAVEERQEPAAFGMALILAALAIAALGVLQYRRSPTVSARKA